MFKSMTQSLQIPHFGYCDEIKLDSAMEFRAVLNGYLSKNPHLGLPKVTMMPIFMKALSQALKKHPLMNAALITDEEGSVKSANLVYRQEHNIALAMDTPNGLIVPNVKHVQSKSILEIALELQRLKELGKKNALGPSDLKGGTITLSNIGSIGGNWMHPVLVQGQLVIGAIGQVQPLPRYTANEKGEEILKKRHVLSVSFNADHRVVDGASMARFVQTWKEYLEHPHLLNLEMR
jgi:2-oxoisovalerate dehydrogenase E2 component (dihydrolipoyl transacylase)